MALVVGVAHDAELQRGPGTDSGWRTRDNAKLTWPSHPDESISPPDYAALRYLRRLEEEGSKALAGLALLATAPANPNASAPLSPRGEGCEDPDPIGLPPSLVEHVSDLYSSTHSRPRLELVAGGRGAGGHLNQLLGPLGVAAGAEGVVVADSGNRRIITWPPGAEHGVLPGGGLFPSSLNFSPVDVALCADGTVAVTGGQTLMLGRPGEVAPRRVGEGCWLTSVICGADGYLYVVDTFEHAVKRVEWPLSAPNLPHEGRPAAACLRLARNNKSPSRAVATPPSRSNGAPQQRHPVSFSPSFLRRPYGIATAMGKDGKAEGFFVVDSGNHRVLLWKLYAREGTLVAGGRGRGSRLDQLDHPRGVVADGAGSIFVSDTLNHRVVRWRLGASCGELLLGGGPPGNQLQQLNRPAGLALDGAGHLLIADSCNHRILRCTLPSHRRR